MNPFRMPAQQDEPAELRCAIRPARCHVRFPSFHVERNTTNQSRRRLLFRDAVRSLRDDRLLRFDALRFEELRLDEPDLMEPGLNEPWLEAELFGERRLEDPRFWDFGTER